MDLNGRVVLQQALPKAAEQLSLDINHLAKGAYMAKINNSVQRFVVE